jgi:hypothetical protein
MTTANKLRETRDAIAATLADRLGGWERLDEAERIAVIATAEATAEAVLQGQAISVRLPPRK